jgi:hypothetical protein
MLDKFPRQTCTGEHPAVFCFLLYMTKQKNKLQGMNSVHAERPGRRELFSRRPTTRTASTHTVGSRAQDSDAPTESKFKLTNLTVKL